MERVDAPFTQEQIDNLNAYQSAGKFHPFTCDRKAPECELNVEVRDYAKDGILIATEDGWVCPCGKYKQNWSHSFMAEKINYGRNDNTGT